MDARETEFKLRCAGCGRVATAAGACVRCAAAAGRRSQVHACVVCGAADAALVTGRGWAALLCSRDASARVRAGVAA